MVHFLFQLLINCHTTLSHLDIFIHTLSEAALVERTEASACDAKCLGSNTALCHRAPNQPSAPLTFLTQGLTVNQKEYSPHWV